MEERWKKLFEDGKLEFANNTTLAALNTADYMAKFRDTSKYVVGPPLSPLRTFKKEQYGDDFVGVYRVRNIPFTIDGGYRPGYGGVLTHDEKAGCVYGDAMHYDQKERDWEEEKWDVFEQ